MENTKIVLIGAGSWSFGSQMLSDLFAARDVLRGSTIALVDVDPKGLDLTSRIAHRLNEATGEPFIIESTTDRCLALPGAKFVIIAFAVKRNELWRLDFQIPLKHGARQVLGENGGPGGLFHAMRNIPILLAICRDIERLCPTALVLNFTNPEGRLCLAAHRYTNLQFVGLCHGIGMAQEAIGYCLNLPADEIDPVAAGLNHFTWLLKMRRTATGEDLYPAFKNAIDQRIEEVEHNVGWGLRLCNFLMNTYGYWPSPSDDHVGEYLSYAWEYCGVDGYDFTSADKHALEHTQYLHNLSSGAEPVSDLLHPTYSERAVPIITGVLANTHQHELAVNVPNNGLIPNLPSWAIVEVPAMIDANGVYGLPVGPLPEPIAAMCHTQIAVIDRVVEAGAHGDRNAALEALLLDPLIGSVAQAEAILSELLAVEKEYLPQFKPI